METLKSKFEVFYLVLGRVPKMVYINIFWSWKNIGGPRVQPVINVTIKTFNDKLQLTQVMNQTFTRTKFKTLVYFINLQASRSETNLFGGSVSSHLP